MRAGRLPDVINEEFKQGLITRYEKETLPRGAASQSLNWMSLGDHISLRGGYAVTGTEVDESSSPVTGLKVVSRFDGFKRLFYTYDRKLMYFDADTGESVEVGSNMLPVEADGEEFAMDEYHSLAGAFLYLSSPSSSFYKVPAANPGYAVDQSMTDHRGRFRIKNGRTWLWRRKGTNKIIDASGLYGSWLDKDELSDYTQYTAESMGAPVGNTCTHILAQVTGKRTCHYVIVTDGTETFSDDRNGNLVGSLGGTGTVNYATGAVVVDFVSAPVNPVTVDYYIEDSTDEGILDFSKDTPRNAGEGFVLRQDSGGADMQNLGTIGGNEFALHVKKTWKVTLSSDDVDAANPVFRQNVGIPNWRAMAESGDGLFYVDALKEDSAYIRMLVPSEYTDNKEIPESISDLLSLTEYRFDQSAMFEWGDYVVVTCRRAQSAANDRMLFRHKLFTSWDVTDFRGNVLDELNGSLVSGDSGSPNVFTLFSGLADGEAPINNFWISGNDPLGFNGNKICNRMVLRGYIGVDQRLEVSVSLDGGPFVQRFIVEGDGTYVRPAASGAIGSAVIGTTQIGGGAAGSLGRYGEYEVEFPITTAIFKRLRFRLRALDVGIATVGSYEFKDIRIKSRGGLPGRSIWSIGSSYTFADIESGVLGFGFETPVGAVDDTNRDFTVAHVPLYIVVNGLQYFEGAGYTRSGLDITLTFGPVGTGDNTFIRSFYR